jgi:triacylglycerol lipase
MSPNSPSIVLINFASPRIGNEKFVKILNRRILSSWFVVNETDIVPDLPPVTLMGIGRTDLYGNFFSRIFVNVQIGDLSSNHSLSTYVCALDAYAKECPSKIMWYGNSQVLVPKKL